MTQTQNQAEAEFCRMVETVRRRVFSGPLADCPADMRREILGGMELKDPLGRVICTLADDDYRERFRRHAAQYQAIKSGAPMYLADGQRRFTPIEPPGEED